MERGRGLEIVTRGDEDGTSIAIGYDRRWRQSSRRRSRFAVTRASNVENGLAAIKDCNISGNTLTGISAISTDEARLHIEDSDVRANRSDQMELPSPTTGRSINRNNTIASVGLGRPRTTHLRESFAIDGSRVAREPSTPQSPL